ncbi:hypothetical protein H310_03589 [Aphanomyces invadans]|uniref:Uncharacterized protein n=1 Tax=Aphanomyces invadans TaxID=157072 RepID=A0A024UHR9_9STRA|nr:hypothetical protein H310_03589 [Aphanomyces invadans]ETW05956.1 hypothetical protein H310_03589 [Aphanomyces invadans]|eukprot:XP_008865733.1 hypothetical protein H310_03589 [Aphanomyces invadans]
MLASLLRVKSACKVFLLRWGTHGDFPAALRVLGDEKFRVQPYHMAQYSK